MSDFFLIRNFCDLSGFGFLRKLRQYFFFLIITEVKGASGSRFRHNSFNPAVYIQAYPETDGICRCFQLFRNRLVFLDFAAKLYRFQPLVCLFIFDSFTQLANLFRLLLADGVCLASSSPPTS